MVHLAFPSLTETAFGSHPCRVVLVSYVRVAPFHGDALPTPRTQILADLVASERKHIGASEVNTDIANHWLLPTSIA